MTPFKLVLAVVILSLLVGALLGTKAVQEEEVHSIDPRGDVTWIPPTTSSTTSSTTTTLPRTHVRNVTPTTARARTAPIVVADNHGEIAAAIRAGFARFGAGVAEEAVKVAGCESTGDDSGSRLNPAARNGSHYGLFQISRTWHDERVQRLGFTWEQMTEVGPNVAVAVDLYAESGWGPWECRWAA